MGLTQPASGQAFSRAGELRGKGRGGVAEREEGCVAIGVKLDKEVGVVFPHLNHDYDGGVCCRLCLFHEKFIDR